MLLILDPAGVVDYEEFLAAALEEQQLVTEARLRAAFNYLDRDGDGAITLDELAQVGAWRSCTRDWHCAPPDVGAGLFGPAPQLELGAG